MILKNKGIIINKQHSVLALMLIFSIYGCLVSCRSNNASSNNSNYLEFAETSDYINDVTIKNESDQSNDIQSNVKQKESGSLNNTSGNRTSGNKNDDISESNYADNTTAQNDLSKLQNKVQLKSVYPLAGFTAPVSAAVTYNEKKYKKYFASDISLFKYCGAWQTDESDKLTMVTYWTVSYVEIDFTGNIILLDLPKKSTFSIKIDGSDYSQQSAVGLYPINVNGSGVHTLRIYNRGNHRRIYFGGAAVPEDQKLLRTTNKKHYVQFIGDSITQNNAYIPVMADDFNWDYSVTAMGAISLRTGYGALSYFNPIMVQLMGEDKVKVGMEEAFFKLEIPADSIGNKDTIERYVHYYEDQGLNYRFGTGYYPDIVFIFLGTNDKLELSSEYDFSVHYNEFVGKILKTYGKNTHVYIMQALNGDPGRYKCIESAALNLIKNYPNNVSFVNQKTVDSWGVEISNDNLHPSDVGYKSLANGIFEYLNTK